MIKIAVLFAEESGVYSEDNRLDIYDEKRDARSYCWIYPVIAHPPCQRWGKMTAVNYARWGGEHNKIGADDGCFKSALASVERCGGVLEHPQSTYAWAAFGLDAPVKGMWTESKEGWVCCVWQSAYGHKANKATWLYYVGEQKPFELNWERPVGTHQVGFQDKRGKAKNKKTLSKKEANATPILFKELLIKLALYKSS